VLVIDALFEQFQLKVKQLLTKFKDVFAWSYKELKGVPKLIYEHKIELNTNACPIKQHPYRMNPNYAQKVRKNLNKLLDA
jgi:hypothetical protein